jgi:hypothetical protein
MAKQGLKKTPMGERFVTLYFWEMDLPAYREMSLAGRALLVEFRRLLFSGHKNGQIGLSVRQAAELLRCHPDTANKALHELQEKGWIRQVVKGGFNFKHRHASTWRVTSHPIDHGVVTPETKEFARWASAEKTKSGPKKPMRTS